MVALLCCNIDIIHTVGFLEDFRPSSSWLDAMFCSVCSLVPTTTPFVATPTIFIIITIIIIYETMFRRLGVFVRSRWLKLPIKGMSFPQTDLGVYAESSSCSCHV